MPSTSDSRCPAYRLPDSITKTERTPIMATQKRPRLFRKLIARVANLAKPSKKPAANTKPTERYPRSSSNTYCYDGTSATMADQEEDFSSLPMPDRFGHKV